MDQKLKGFFDTASQKANEANAVVNAAAQREAERRETQAENMRRLKSAIDAELGPILNVLRSLPGKNGNAFAVALRNEFPKDSTTAIYELYVSCTDSGRRYEYNSEHRCDLPYVRQYFILDKKGRLKMGSERPVIDVPEQSGEYSWYLTGKSFSNFEKARQELALGLASIATNHIAEIGEKLGAMQPAAETGAINVFNKPLQFKNTQTSAQKKHFWQLW